MLADPFCFLHPFRDGARRDAVPAGGRTDATLFDKGSRFSSYSRGVGVDGICHMLGNEPLKWAGCFQAIEPLRGHRRTDYFVSYLQEFDFCCDSNIDCFIA